MNAPASPLAFDKIVGTGNDFLFFDLRERPLSEFTRLSRGELAIRAADRHNGVGADGVVFVERNEGEPALKWDFFNSDGSRAAMCGNALRCMGLWAREWLRSETVRFLTARGPIDVSHVEGEFHAELAFLRLEPREIAYSTDGRGHRAVLIDTGVPHVVVELDSIDNVKARAADVSALRFHPEIGEGGANVTFFERRGPVELRTITFERGVEDFTLSCGTGVLAAAAVGLGISSAAPPGQAREARLETPGGELRVRFETRSGKVVLIGPATHVCAGRLAEEILR